MKYANKKTPARSSEYVLSEDEKDVQATINARDCLLGLRPRRSHLDTRRPHDHLSCDSERRGKEGLRRLREFSRHNILRYFDKIGLKSFNLQTYKEELIGFSGEKVRPNGYVTLHLTLGARPRTRTIKMDFLVVDYPSTYNVILRRPTLNKIRAIIFTAYFITPKSETRREMKLETLPILQLHLRS